MSESRCSYSAPAGNHASINCSSLCALATALLFLVGPVGHAAELGFTIAEGIESTDNANLTSANEVRETIYTTELGVTLNQDSPKQDTRIEFLTEYRDYRNNIFDDENVPSLSATVDWTVVPGRFTWILQDVLTQEEIDGLEAATPDNKQDVNNFTTGPDFFFRITQTDAIQVGLRYTDSYFEETDEDSERYSQSIGWQHELSSRTGVSLNFENEAVEFDDNILNEDFDRQDLFIRLDTQQAKNQFQFEIGATSIDRDRGEDGDEPLARFSWNRRLSDRSSLDVSVVREVSDAGRNITVEAPGSSGPGDVFIDKRLNVGYTLARRRTTIKIDLFGRKQDFKLTKSEEKNRGIDVEIKRNVSRKLTFTLVGGTTRTEFVDIRRVDKDTSFGASLSYRLGRTLSLSVTAEQNHRDSDDSFQDYKENRAMLQIAYNNRSPIIPVSER